MTILEDQKLTGVRPIGEDKRYAVNPRNLRIKQIDFTDLSKFFCKEVWADYLYEYELHQYDNTDIHLLLQRDKHRNMRGERSTKFSWTEKPEGIK